MKRSDRARKGPLVCKVCGVLVQQPNRIASGCSAVSTSSIIMNQEKLTVDFRVDHRGGQP